MPVPSVPAATTVTPILLAIRHYAPGHSLTGITYYVLTHHASVTPPPPDTTYVLALHSRNDQ